MLGQISPPVSKFSHEAWERVVTFEWDSGTLDFEHSVNGKIKFVFASSNPLSNSLGVR